MRNGGRNKGWLIVHYPRKESTMEDVFARQYVKRILMKEKKKLRIAFLGGSLSKGEMVKSDKCFVSLFEARIVSALGGEKEISVLRYGESGTLSANGLFKVQQLIAEKPDLVFIDYAMNDPGDRYLWETTEGICYQLSKAEIGVVILLFCNERGQCTRGAMERTGAHYHLPVYDIGKKIMSQMEKGTLTWQQYGQDYVHPTEYGHELIAEYLLRLFVSTEGIEEMEEITKLPEEPAFAGAFRQTKLLDLTGRLQDARAGDVVFSQEIETRMILMEFWQDSVPNHASAVIVLDGKKIATADAYASMAWGNPVSRYIGGDGRREKHQLTVFLGKGSPPAGWDYTKLRLRFLFGV